MKLIKHKNLLKNFITVFIFIGIIIAFGCYTASLNSRLDSVILDNNKIKDQLMTTTTELEAANDCITTIQDKINSLDQELLLAYEKIEAKNIEIEQYKQEIEDEEAKWKKRYEEYPVATEAWIAMKTYGWSDTVCAGIMGNLMAETGGTGTLHLDWDSNGGNGYGLVQWIGGRRSTIKNRYGTYPTVKEQIQFVHDELFGANGVRQQVTISQLDAIMTAETPEECAYAFACYYERCAEFARGMRRGFARDAYEYFVD